MFQKPLAVFQTVFYQIPRSPVWSLVRVWSAWLHGWINLKAISCGMLRQSLFMRVWSVISSYYVFIIPRQGADSNVISRNRRHLTGRAHNTSEDSCSATRTLLEYLAQGARSSMISRSRQHLTGNGHNKSADSCSATRTLLEYIAQGARSQMMSKGRRHLTGQGHNKSADSCSATRTLLEYIAQGARSQMMSKGRRHLTGQGHNTSGDSCSATRTLLEYFAQGARTSVMSKSRQNLAGRGQNKSDGRCSATRTFLGRGLKEPNFVGTIRPRIDNMSWYVASSLPNVVILQTCRTWCLLSLCFFVGMWGATTFDTQQYAKLGPHR